MTLSCEKGFLAGNEDDRCRLSRTDILSNSIWAGSSCQKGLVVIAQLFSRQL